MTPVKSGENSRKTLRNDSVVRALFKAFELPGKAGAERRQVFDLTLEPEWAPANMGIAAFLQDPESLEIYGASAIRLNDFL